MENKVIQINCVGNIDEILSSLKEVVIKLEDYYNNDLPLEKGKQIESFYHSVLLTVRK